ncbi:uncharacterized protein ACNLHF_024750 [Anomaloglossus baeobatrachus]
MIKGWRKKIKRRTIDYSGVLSEDERKQAEEVKERTRRLLSDVLKKKKSLLVEDPKLFGILKLETHKVLITTDLVEELMQELEKVTFAKDNSPEENIGVNAYVYPSSKDKAIYLCAGFWKKDPTPKSQEETIIHEVSHFLGYEHKVQKNKDRVQKSPQSMLCPLTAYSVASALTSEMDHLGSYTDGSYSCCGETSRDTVCEKSRIGKWIRAAVISVTKRVVAGSWQYKGMTRWRRNKEKITKQKRRQRFMIIMNWRQTLLGRRYTAGEKTATASDDSDSEDDDAIYITKWMSDNSQMLKRLSLLLKRHRRLLKIQTNLLKEKHLIVKQNNLRKPVGDLLGSRAKQGKTLANMRATKANRMKTAGQSECNIG